MALIGYGSGVGKALEAAEQLAGHEIAVTVADARFAKPIDAGLMAQLAAEHDLLVTVEEGVLAGGFGSAVWETLNETGTGPIRIIRVGLPDRYVTHGKPALLHEEVGFTGERIAERVVAAISDRGRGSACSSTRASDRPGRRSWVRKGRSGLSAEAARRRPCVRVRGVGSSSRTRPGRLKETARLGERAVSGGGMQEENDALASS